MPRAIFCTTPFPVTADRDEEAAQSLLPAEIASQASY